MNARDAMLERVRRAVEAGGSAAPPVRRDYRRAGSLAPGSAEAVDLLVDRLTDYRAEVARCGPSDVAAALAELLRGAESVVTPEGLADEVRDGVRDGARTVLVDGRPAPLRPVELDTVTAVVTQARVAIATTGTLVLDGSAGQGRRVISLVPPRHVVVLWAGQVVESVPEGLARLRPTAPLTMISGPSATSDIELSRVEGVHGPAALQMLIAGPGR